MVHWVLSNFTFSLFPILNNIIVIDPLKYVILSHAVHFTLIPPSRPEDPCCVLTVTAKHFERAV